jgi:hypothetical protein
VIDADLGDRPGFFRRRDFVDLREHAVASGARSPFCLRANYNVARYPLSFDFAFARFNAASPKTLDNCMELWISRKFHSSDVSFRYLKTAKRLSKINPAHAYPVDT